MYSGYLVNVGSKTRFVIPAIVTEVVVSMVRTLMETDPQDKFTVSVEWTDRELARPEYGPEECAGERT